MLSPSHYCKGRAYKSHINRKARCFGFCLCVNAESKQRSCRPHTRIYKIVYIYGRMPT